MSTEKVITLATYGTGRLVETHGTGRLVETPENEGMSGGWAICRQRLFFSPVLIIRKFEFEDEARRAWKDFCNGVTDDDIQSRDYSGAPPRASLGEPIPLVDHKRLLKRGRR